MYSSSDPIDPSVLRLVQEKSLVRIVDDDETVAKSYEFMLRCSGWNCRIFNSAEDYLASENVQIGCLILDVRMPGLSGLQLQQKLEILEREIPIIFVTGHGDIRLCSLCCRYRRAASAEGQQNRVRYRQRRRRSGKGFLLRLSVQSHR